MSKKRVSEDERIRRQACTDLGGQLESLRSMVERCEVLADGVDPINAIIAAAALARANAQLGISLARVAKVETRHRSITEKPKENAPRRAELNSRNFLPPPQESPNKGALNELIRKIEAQALTFEDEDRQLAIEDMKAATPSVDLYTTFFTWVGEEEQQDDDDEGLY